MNTDLHAFVVKRLLDSRGRWPTIAQRSGVSKRTLEKIARREVEDPRISNVEKLAAFFVAEDAPKRTKQAA